MIKLSPTGKAYKNANGEHCLETKYTVTITVDNVGYANIDEKVAELTADAGRLKQVLEGNIIKD